MAAEDGARTTDSGLIFLPLKTGTGATPTSVSVVELNYHGTLRDGTVFDSSVERGQAVQIPLERVHPCWQEGISMLKEGGKAKITCPAKLTYQDRVVLSIPPGAAITFEVELLKIVK
jgi:FKBP-type peptidyl-prolyl cis-trans isomerase